MKSKRKRNRKLLAPRRLAEKLKKIRVDLKISQADMVQIVNPFETESKNRARVSQYERNIRIPSPVEIFNYAKYVGISTDVLLDDEQDLPSRVFRVGKNCENAQTALAAVNQAPGNIQSRGEPL